MENMECLPSDICWKPWPTSWTWGLPLYVAHHRPGPAFLGEPQSLQSHRAVSLNVTEAVGLCPAPSAHSFRRLDLSPILVLLASVFLQKFLVASLLDLAYSIG